MYTYGLFINPSRIALEMDVNNLYKVECLIAKEGDDELFANEGEFSAPFLYGVDKAAKITSSPVFSRRENLSSLARDEATIAKGRAFRHPRLVKFYNTINDFDPKTSEELAVSIKRSMFGLYFKMAPPEESNLVVGYIG